MKKALLGLIAFPLLFATSVYAADTCMPIFGGGTSCQNGDTLTIDTKVKNPSTNQFVDTLSTNDAHYAPDQTVSVKVTVSHPGSGTVRNVTVKNIFPSYVQFQSGNGLYDTSAHVLSFTIDQLGAKATKTYTVQARILSAQELPTSTPTICMVNASTAQSGGTNVADNSQFCVDQPLAAGSTPTDTQNGTQRSLLAQGPTSTPLNPNQTKGGLPVYQTQSTSQTPATGPEALGLVALLPVGGLGVFLRRKSQ